MHRLANRPRQPSPARLRHYLALERQEFPHPAIRAIRSRKPEGNEPRRAAEYLAIARGRTT